MTPDGPTPEVADVDPESRSELERQQHEPEWSELRSRARERITAPRVAADRPTSRRARRGQAGV